LLRISCHILRAILHNLEIAHSKLQMSSQQLFREVVGFFGHLVVLQKNETVVPLLFAASKDGRRTGRGEWHFEGDGLLRPKTIRAAKRSSVYFKMLRNFRHKHRHNGALIGDLFAEIRACNDARLINKNHPPSREHVELDEEAFRILSFYYT